MESKLEIFAFLPFRKNGTIAYPIIGRNYKNWAAGNLQIPSKFKEISIHGRALWAAGEYMSYHEPGSLTSLPDYEYGTITFLNPLVIAWETEDFPMDYSLAVWGWKSSLFNKFGKKSEDLSSHLLSLGYDGIITTGAFGPNSIGEIINFCGIKKEEF